MLQSREQEARPSPPQGMSITAPFEGSDGNGCNARANVNVWSSLMRHAKSVVLSRNKRHSREGDAQRFYLFSVNSAGLLCAHQSRQAPWQALMRIVFHSVLDNFMRRVQYRTCLQGRWPG